MKLAGKERGDNHHWFELDVKEKKALRDESDLEIHDFKLSLHEDNAKIDVEHRLKEEEIRVSYVTPQIWREKCHKVEIAISSAEHWKNCFSALNNESLGWLKEKAQMNILLNTYAGSTNLLQPATALYRVKYDCLARFCNELTQEVPWKLEDALKDTDEKSTPHSILQFLYLCDRMMKRFKVELKEMKERKAKRVI